MNDGVRTQPGDREVRVRRAVPGDEAILRDLRLQAMADAPEAFGSNRERELRRTTADWRRWMAPGATFLLEAGGAPSGLVAVAREAADSSVMNLMAMWVAPSLRGTGAAERLVEAVRAFAESEGGRLVRLEVIKANGRAQALYRKCGFVPTGHESVLEGDGRIEIRMERPARRD